jgi:hypothetical protein
VVVRVETAAEFREAVQIESAMPLFVDQGRDESAAKLSGGLRPPQQGPGKILDRLQLMMSETGKTELASFEFAKFAGRGESVAAGSHLDPGISCRPVDVSDRPRRGIRQRLAILSGGRGEFCIEIALHEDLEAEAF